MPAGCWGNGEGRNDIEPNPRLDEEKLTRAVIALATKYGRYGYRRITALLRGVGWEVGKDRVQQIWRREGLKVPQKQKPPGSVVVERRLLCATTAGATEPRLELRLHECQNARGENAAAADLAG